MQRQQQHQQHARNSKGEIQGRVNRQPDQSNAQAQWVWQVDFFCTLPIVPTNLVVINEHDQGDRALMLRNVRRHH